MDTRTEARPSPVAATPKQGGDIRARWAWVEPSVWTDGMLAALENGVKGGKWFSLVDKVWSERNLRAGFAKVKANRGAAGVDGVGVTRMEGELDAEIARLSSALKDGTYEPRAVKRAWVPKPGSKEKRPLGVPTVRDRTVQTALRNVLEPIFERKFSENSYGFRPGRGCKDALREVDRLLHAGNVWVVDADLKSYFDRIPHDRLLSEVGKEVADGRALDLVRKFLKQNVLDGLKEWTPEEGSPQGAVISPLLANIYLDPLDHMMEAAGRGMIRYADDFVALCRTKEEAEAALESVRVWTAAAGLALHPEKTRIVDAAVEDFEFLGYRFSKGRKWPRKKSLDKLKDGVRELTGRANGKSLDEIVAKLNRKLAGWFGYFKHSYKTTFPSLDGWIRRRLRSILRKRGGRRGVCRNGSDNQRWPNAFFANHGLFSLTGAHAEAVQSRRS